ncbi:two-component regulator propeller domain-containing protein [Aquimarina agarilytica]|uniref:two-component regulator propeller domain-containing protein n=1 Tax=Aquimarina agarilytica TaxID=1087449 RepID=UPI000287CC16|nr:two-component regulator propeller domain-containing protein [Aquimarina agarilytica]
MKNVLVYIFYALLVFNQAYCQYIKFENFTTDNGLSNNSVVDIENDNDGGLWIATWDGLNYYDGYDFVVFKHDETNENSIGGNYIANIEKDKEGSIWVITGEGKVSRYLGDHTFQHFQFNFTPSKIQKSHEGSIFVFGKNQSYKFTGTAFVLADFNEINHNNSAFFKGILHTKYPDVIINDVLQDDKNNIWFATRRNGLFILPNNVENFDNNKIDHYLHDNYASHSLNSNEIEKLHKDYFGNIWLAQKDGGLSMAYKDSDQISTVAHHPTKYPHLPNETIRAITTDKQGIIWLGYYTKGLFYYDVTHQCYIKFEINESKKNQDWERIRTLSFTSDGSIWVGTYGGVIKIKDKKYTLYDANTIPNYANNRCYSFYEDNEKQLWVAGWGGLSKYNLQKNTFEAFEGQELLSSYHIRNIKKHKGTLLIATEQQGVIFFDVKHKKTTKISEQDGVLGNSVFSILVDELNENYWIASLGGITIYNKKKGILKKITEKEGLPSHLVYGVLAGDDKIWVTTTKGIAYIDKNNFSVKPITADGGIAVKEFSEGAYYRDPKGGLYFGGINGLIYFNPKSVNFSKNKSKIKVRLAGENEFLKRIVRKHEQNDFKITITPVVFPSTHTATFYYKLEGFDQHWKSATAKKELLYEDLPSGKYDFFIRDTNAPTKEHVFGITVEKSFYETTNFYLFALFFFVGGTFVFLQLKNKRNRIQQQKLESQIVERTQVIHNQKEDLLKVNSILDEKNQEILSQKEQLLQLHHNLKNQDFEIEAFKTFVLSEFQKPVSKIIKASYKVKDELHVREQLLNQSGKIIDLISQWNNLDYIKDIGAKKNVLVNIQPVINEIVKRLGEKLKGNKVNFEAQISTDIGWVEIDLLRFKLLFQYLFNDLIKYSDIHTNLVVQLTYREGAIHFRILSNSKVLINNWCSISSFSPYFKAFKILVADLEGDFATQINDQFKATLQIPVALITSVEKTKEIISWKHLDLSEQLSLNKNTILVFAEKTNFSVANQLLENEADNLIFENTIGDLLSVIKQVTIDALVLYQSIFDKELVSFLKTNIKKSGNKKIPVLYISEEINYELLEKSMVFNIDEVIQLPTSDVYIRNKILALIDNNEENKIENKFNEEILKILTEDDDLLTANEKLLKQSVEIIKKELSNPSFNIEKLISIQGISRIKCYRMFKELTGKSPSDVLSSLRLQKAAFLLRNKKLNISEISFECGYNDSKYFGRMFKKSYGVSPKVFKEQSNAVHELI